MKINEAQEKKSYADWNQIRADVAAGIRICWRNTGYTIARGGGDLLIRHANGSCVGVIESQYPATEFFSLGEINNA